jgi:nucleotide-binding universal stress UspA family protein
MYRRILVPLDGSRTSQLGLAEAVRLAKTQGSSLRLVHVVDELVLMTAPDMSYDFADLIETLKEDGKKILEKGAAHARKHGLKVQTSLIESFGGRAAQCIIDEAKKFHASLIVLGTHGRRGMKRVVMGSDAEEVVRNSPAPVLLVRSGPAPKNTRTR